MPYLNRNMWQTYSENYPLRLFFLVLFAPIVVLAWLPSCVLAKWLIDSTEQKLYWPKEVLDSLGQPLGMDKQLKDAVPEAVLHAPHREVLPAGYKAD